MILEIGKSYVDKFYNGNIGKCIEGKGGNAWTDEKIIKSFKSDKRFKEYMENNKNYCFFVNI